MDFPETFSIYVDMGMQVYALINRHCPAYRDGTCASYPYRNPLQSSQQKSEHSDEASGLFIRRQTTCWLASRGSIQARILYWRHKAVYGLTVAIHTRQGAFYCTRPAVCRLPTSRLLPDSGPDYARFRRFGYKRRLNEFLASARRATEAGFCVILQSLASSYDRSSLLGSSLPLQGSLKRLIMKDLTRQSKAKRKVKGHLTGDNRSREEVAKEANEEVEEANWDVEEANGEVEEANGEVEEANREVGRQMGRWRRRNGEVEEEANSRRLSSTSRHLRFCASVVFGKRSASPPILSVNLHSTYEHLTMVEGRGKMPPHRARRGILRGTHANGHNDRDTVLHMRSQMPHWDFVILKPIDAPPPVEYGCDCSALHPGVIRGAAGPC
ncbi:hypothetical protein CAPTEDRAFT_186685 [Capitella teleta]|uniref:Uncharacterized protein n=1 Tax=Capitella teleta TaxID=283909 RepID=R7TQW3_CAPTE|nr:hypothetical protein CAPTEDRAFT_186685 [Capitella teleta]|eukprot:ELT95962.1 hypothetical protein CAPTEDRAFT_186685 [Capitella teleta]